MKNKKLHVITMISNPIRYKSRYRLYNRFQERMKDTPGVVFHTVEVAFGERCHEVTTPSEPNHLLLRTHHELWHKENALALMVQRLPSDWEYLAWVDADIMFSTNPHGWAREAIHQLQHYAIIQLFQDAIDLGPDGEVIQAHKGFCYQYRRGAPRGPKYEFWHPGFAWATTRQTYDMLGGFGNLEHAVLGAADHHLALALIGKAKESVPGGIDPAYLDPLLVLEDRCTRHIKGNIGFVPGTILHEFHGKKKDRKYVERWDILTRNKYNPRTDLKRDHQGLWQLETSVPRQVSLRDGIRRYFRQRNEDSIDVT